MFYLLSIFIIIQLLIIKVTVSNKMLIHRDQKEMIVLSNRKLSKISLFTAAIAGVITLIRRNTLKNFEELEAALLNPHRFSVQKHHW